MAKKNSIYFIVVKLIVVFFLFSFIFCWMLKSLPQYEYQTKQQKKANVIVYYKSLVSP